MTSQKAKLSAPKALLKTRIRDRSAKARPQNTGELITAIDDGRLDGRTAPAKRITALRTAIATAPLEACIGVVRDILAVNLTIAQVITAEISRPGFQVLLPAGELNPLLTEYWQDTQKSLLNAAQTLARMEERAAQSSASGANGPVKNGIDISALVLEASETEANE